MNELERIVAATRVEVAVRRVMVPVDELEQTGAERLVKRDLRPFAQALASPGLSLIAEHKRSSPSAGSIRDSVPLADVVRAYERGGAAALSRKDFIVDPYQVAESLAAGADAILLIVAALSPVELSALLGQARALELAALVEVHDADELAIATDAGAEMIGINNRDLTTLGVDTRRTFELLPSIPPGTLVVAESGFKARQELDQLAHAGVNAVLVGEALMRAEDIESATRALAKA
jgi:indole-3-glycerol phosphate synthase